jgi:hypothetical protein
MKAKKKERKMKERIRKYQERKKKERLALLLYMRETAKELGVHPVYPSFRDDLVTRDPTPWGEDYYPCSSSNKPPPGFEMIYL